MSSTHLPARLRVLIMVLTACTIAILSWAGWDLMCRTGNAGWIVPAFLASIAVPLTIVLPTAESTVFVGELYLVAIAATYGSSACVVVTAFCAVISLLNARRLLMPSMLIIDFCGMVCAAFIYSTAYQLAKPTYGEFWDVVPVLALVTVVSFLLKSFVSAMAVSLKRGHRVAGFWAKAYLPLVPIPVISAVSGAAIYSYPDRYVPLMFLPVIGLVWGWGKFSARRAAVLAPLQSSQVKRGLEEQVECRHVELD